MPRTPSPVFSYNPGGTWGVRCMFKTRFSRMPLTHGCVCAAHGSGAMTREGFRECKGRKGLRHRPPSKTAVGSHLLPPPPRLFRQDASDVEATASSASSPSRGKVKGETRQRAPRRAARASFSASGRKVPLEPRRSEACRSCQPMHLLSFGEGRKKWLCFCVGVLLCDVHVWSACRAATAVGQEFRPGQRDCVWSAIPFKMSLQACLYRCPALP
ncbi:hypothetical protein LSM04_002024 [Trypanosoma melophagium]|uniref:uncharacterized protein n=1 Tax=Trypanosoma melophagium TaxID=715481 RepID=UPI00351A7439|nr:hypothetical protein LSM04_002024 [Trypanosoma melophagium]